MLTSIIFLLKYFAGFRYTTTFAPVFHGIRFKVRRLFVVMTSNFFLPQTNRQCFHWVFNMCRCWYLPSVYQILWKRLLPFLSFFWPFYFRISWLLSSPGFTALRPTLLPDGNQRQVSLKNHRRTLSGGRNSTTHFLIHWFPWALSVITTLPWRHGE